VSGSGDYPLPGNLQGGPAEIGGESVAVPAGCAALWNAGASSVDAVDIESRAGEAARRTHKDQAVLLPDGTVKVISGGVPEMTTN
jgi:hypothetical protein